VARLPFEGREDALVLGRVGTFSNLLGSGAVQSCRNLLDQRGLDPAAIRVAVEANAGAPMTPLPTNVAPGMRRTFPLATLILLLLISCTDASPSLVPPPTGGREPATASAGAGSGTLVVRQRYRGPGSYVEGSVGFVEVSAAGTAEVARWERQILGSGRRRFSLQAGTYSLTSWQRPCDGNCQDGFDPPVDGCEESFTIGAGETATAVVAVTPDSGCTIAFRR
jgi:hypothetical protein